MALAALKLTQRSRRGNRRRVRRTASGRSFAFNLRFPGQYFDSETGLHYNVRRDYDPATGRYHESDPAGLRGGVNTYAYVGGNPLVFFDSLGLSPQDVNNAWTWLQQNYPDLTNGVSFGPSWFLDQTGEGGVYFPGTKRFLIRKEFYTKDCLTKEELSDLRNTLAHEALHIFLESKVGAWNFLWNSSFYGYHDWIYRTAAAIATYQDLALPGTPQPSIVNYPPGLRH